MNDEELDRAIRTVHAMLFQTGTALPHYDSLNNHLQALLAAQAKRVNSMPNLLRPLPPASPQSL